MKPLLLSLTLLMLTAGAVALEPVEGFLTDYQAAQAQAKKENKPLYLHFTAEGCVWCRRIEDDIYKTPEGKKILAPFVKASLNCTASRGQQPTGKVRTYLELMRKNGGQGFPFLLMTTPDGEVLGHIGGYLPLPRFKKEIEAVLKRWDAIKGMNECKAKGDKSSLTYHQHCLTYYLDKDDWVKAGQAAAALLKLDPKGQKTDVAEIAYARLCAALAAKADVDKISVLQKAVAQADPKNEKGYLEKAYASRIKALMMEGQEKPPNQQQEILRRMVPLLKEMLRQVPAMSNKIPVSLLLFQVQAKLGDFDGAIQTLEGIKKAAPESLDMKEIDAMILKLQEAKAAAEAKPADAPKEKPAEKKAAPAEK